MSTQFIKNFYRRVAEILCYPQTNRDTNTKEGNIMGYYKNLELENVIEEPDRPLTRRALKNHRRETYRAPKHWVVTNFDMTLIWMSVPMAFILGVCVTLIFTIASGR